MWNKRGVKGDFDLEVAFAPLEATVQRVHSAFPINLNVMFCADGKYLDSGYNLIYGTRDIPSKLYRKGKLVAENSDLILPRFRLERAHFYRAMTQNWQRVRIRRIQNRFEIFSARFDRYGWETGIEMLFSFDDPTPLEGQRFGIWSWGQNGLALAKATLSFEEETGPKIAQAPTGASPSGLTSEMETIVNLASGGEFKSALRINPFYLKEKGLILFDYRFSGKPELGLFLRQKKSLLQFSLAGPHVYRTGTIPLGQLETESDNKWHKLEVNLSDAVFQARPDAYEALIDEIFIASPMVSVEQIGGLGKNRLGDSYSVKNLSLSKPEAPAQSTELPPPGVLVYAQEPLDDFERGPGQWRNFGGPSGALLWRDPKGANSGNYGMRLFNPVVAGPAGAVVTSEPFDARFFPQIRFDYLFPQDLEINLVLRFRGNWYEIVVTGTDSSWTVIGAIPNIQADGRWHQASFELKAALRRVSSGGGPLMVDSLYWADDERMGNVQDIIYRFDNFCRVPAVSLERPTEFIFTIPGGTPAAFSCVFDDRPDTAPNNEPTGDGGVLRTRVPKNASYLHVRVRDSKGKWSPVTHMPVAVRKVPPYAPASDKSFSPRKTGPPSAPRITLIPSNRLCFYDFEWGEDAEGLGEKMGESGIRRSAWVLPCLNDGATGSGSLEVTNIMKHEFFSAYLHKGSYSLRRYPRISFDYKFLSGGCAINLTGLLNKEMFVVQWLTTCQPGTYFYPFVIGQLPMGRQDDKWHHVDFDLLKMVGASGRAQSGSLPLTVEQFNTWAMTNGRPMYNNPLGARVRFDNITIYSPDGRSPSFNWKVPGHDGRKFSYSYLLDTRPETVPQEKPLTTKPAVHFDDLKPGGWYFHVRAKNTKGEWGAASHYRFDISN